VLSRPVFRPLYQQHGLAAVLLFFTRIRDVDARFTFEKR
jgi:hypothetical protein